jgi:DNA-binding NarL/FixJ family response regulator
VHVRNIMKKLHATNRTQVALLLRGATSAIAAVESAL